jgi:hypothetical protein
MIAECCGIATGLNHLLRPRNQRPPRRAAKPCDKIAPLHSITSSARARREGGTLSFSILAVSALMTSSNLLDCKTGRSVGLAPLRVWPTLRCII